MPLAVSILPLALILMEPDLGTVLLIMPVLLGMLFLAGARLRHLALIAALGLSVTPLLWMKMQPYQRLRITAVLLQSEALRKDVTARPEVYRLLNEDAAALRREARNWTHSSGMQLVRSKAALGSALATGRKRADTLFHSDRGIEYVAHDFRNTLRTHGLVQSVSRKANPYDNAHMESFFASLKTEMVHHETLHNMAHAKRCVRRYIKFYNHQRRHSALDYRSPAEYEANAA